MTVASLPTREVFKALAGAAAIGASQAFRNIQKELPFSPRSSKDDTTPKKYDSSSTEYAEAKRAIIEMDTSLIEHVVEPDDEKVCDFTDVSPIPEIIPMPNTLPKQDTAPDNFGVPEQGMRDFGVRVKPTGGGGGGIRVEVPFPLSLAVGGGYLLYSLFSDSTPSDTTKPKPKAGSSSATSSMPPPKPEQNDDSEDDENPMKTLEEQEIEEIYEKLMKRAPAKESPGSNKTIWQNKNFRIDVGHVDHKKGVRNWEFQVNKDAEKWAKKRFLKDGNTHKKLVKGKVNFKNPLSFEDWKKEIRN